MGDKHDIEMNKARKLNTRQLKELEAEQTNMITHD